jgi:hypothetical protein
MRPLVAIVMIIVVAFVGVLGFYWLRDGSLESAGREMDEKLGAIDRTTEPLQETIGDVGEATGETIERATDGDDDT